MAQSSVAVSHENLDIEYYCFDYQFYKGIQLGKFLVVSYINCSSSLPHSLVTAGEEEEERKENENRVSKLGYFRAGYVHLPLHRSVFSST